MKALVGSIILLTGGFLFSGCFNVGSAEFPEPVANFQPRKTYGVSVDDLWKAVNAALQGQRISVASGSKADGRMTTDYIQGPTQLNLVPGMPTLTTRYRYNITVQSIGQSQSSLTIFCTLESSSEAVAWHDVSKDNAERVTSLEYWLYEKIEKSLSAS